LWQISEQTLILYLTLNIDLKPLLNETLWQVQSQ